MRIRTELDNLSESDIYSLILFSLYKARKVPEYASLSQLAYILDKDNLLKLCEFFGGITLTIPKIEELELLTYALLMVQQVDIEHNDFDTIFDKYKDKVVDAKHLKSSYFLFKDLLSNYNFVSNRENDE